jgi:hypothetical protein
MLAWQGWIEQCLDERTAISRAQPDDLMFADDFLGAEMALSTT